MVEKISRGRMRFHRKFVILSITLLSLVAALFTSGAAHANGLSPLAETQWVGENIGKPEVKLVYVGFMGEDDRKKFEETHIGGSAYLSMAELMDALGNGSAPPSQEKFEKLMGSLGISNDSQVVVYGTPAGNPFVPAVYWLMKYFGHDNVKVLNGSLDQWTRETRVTASEPMAVKPTMYKAKKGDSSIITDAAYVLKNLKNEKVVLVDARSSEEFVGEEDRNKRKGHIPGAINLNFYPTNRTGVGTFKPVEELKKAYEEKGVTKDKEVIVYCETGPRAADSYIALKDLLAYPNVKVYIGSWREWGNDLDEEKYPLEK